MKNHQNVKRETVTVIETVYHYVNSKRGRAHNCNDLPFFRRHIMDIEGYFFSNEDILLYHLFQKGLVRKNEAGEEIKFWLSEQEVQKEMVQRKAVLDGKLPSVTAGLTIEQLMG